MKVIMSNERRTRESLCGVLLQIVLPSYLGLSPAMKIAMQTAITGKCRAAAHKTNANPYQFA
jgi:hypothetical protein